MARGAAGSTSATAAAACVCKARTDAPRGGDGSNVARGEKAGSRGGDRTRERGRREGARPAPPAPRASNFRMQLRGRGRPRRAAARQAPRARPRQRPAWVIIFEAFEPFRDSYCFHRTECLLSETARGRASGSQGRTLARHGRHEVSWRQRACLLARGVCSDPDASPVSQLQGGAVRARGRAGHRAAGVPRLQAARRTERQLRAPPPPPRLRQREKCAPRRG